MVARKAMATLAAALFILALAPMLWADGFIRLDPPRVGGVRQVPLAVKYHKVDVKIDNQAAVTEVDQVFVNTNDFQVEGTYMFPLPNNANISDFSMWIDGKEQKAELLDADRARQIYEDYVRRAIDPALLEYVGMRMFRMSIFPIPPRQERRIRLSYSEVIPQTSGICAYRYPLNTEKFSSMPLEQVSICATIKSKNPIKLVYSPTHAIDVARKDDFNARASMEQRNVTPDKDFLLYYTATSSELGLNLVSFRKEGEEGYFMMMLSPGTNIENPLPKDVIFVFDTSGSMAEKDKIGQAKKALRYCVNSLGEQDQFNIVTFATEARLFENALLTASKANKEKALDFVKDIRAAGGTNINEALLKALEMAPKEGNRPYVIVFMTDGQPTIDVTDPNVILKNVGAKNQGKVRFFTFGVGYDVNTHLLDRLAEENRGSGDYVTPEEDIEAKVSGFYQKVAYPVLSDVKLDFGKVKAYDIYPKVPADLFSGSQVVVFGRYGGDGHSAITLTGQTAKGSKTLQFEGNFASKEVEANYIPRLWAVSKIGYLLDEIRLRGENQELKREVVDLAKRYGIITPYTSYLVQEDLRIHAQPVPIRRALDSGAVPGGFGGGGGRGGESEGRDRFDKAAADSKKEDFDARTGEKGVQASKEFQKMKGNGPAASAPPSAEPLADDEKNEERSVFKDIRKAIKAVDEKTFYLADGIWYDSDYKEGATKIKVKYLSDEFFKIVKEKPSLAKYFALGAKVIVVLDGTTYEVTE